MSKVKFQNPLAFLQNSKISGHQHVSYICFKNIAKLHVQQWCSGAGTHGNGVPT